VTTKAGVATTVRVRDVMSKPVVYIDAAATVFDAANELTNHHITGAPVLRDGVIVGMVSKSDLVDPRNELQARVDRVMTQVVYAVQADDPLMLGVQLMVDESIHRAIVVDGAGTLVGIITPMDVLRALRGGLALGGNARVDVRYIDLRRFAS
jgi:predicted transcriptional regulator